MRIASHFAAWCDARSCSYLQGQRHARREAAPTHCSQRQPGFRGRSRRLIERIAVAQVNTMKLVLALAAVGASAFGGFGKSAAPAPARSGGNQVAQGGQTVTNIQVPKIFTTAFGDPGRLQERAARAEAKKAEAEAQSAPVRRPSPRATCRVVSVHCAAARHPAPPDSGWTTLG